MAAARMAGASWERNGGHFRRNTIIFVTIWMISLISGRKLKENGVLRAKRCERRNSKSVWFVKLRGGKRLQDFLMRCNLAYEAKWDGDKGETPEKANFSNVKVDDWGGAIFRAENKEGIDLADHLTYDGQKSYPELRKFMKLLDEVGTDNYTRATVIRKSIEEMGGPEVPYDEEGYPDPEPLPDSLATNFTADNIMDFFKSQFPQEYWDNLLSHIAYNAPSSFIRAYGDNGQDASRVVLPFQREFELYVAASRPGAPKPGEAGPSLPPYPLPEKTYDVKEETKTYVQFGPTLPPRLTLRGGEESHVKRGSNESSSDDLDGWDAGRMMVEAGKEALRGRSRSPDELIPPPRDPDELVSHPRDLDELSRIFPEEVEEELKEIDKWTEAMILSPNFNTEDILCRLEKSLGGEPLPERGILQFEKLVKKVFNASDIEVLTTIIHAQRIGNITFKGAMKMCLLRMTKDKLIELTFDDLIEMGFSPKDSKTLAKLGIEYVKENPLLTPPPTPVPTQQPSIHPKLSPLASEAGYVSFSSSRDGIYTNYLTGGGDNSGREPRLPLENDGKNLPDFIPVEIPEEKIKGGEDENCNIEEVQGDEEDNDHPDPEIAHVKREMARIIKEKDLDQHNGKTSVNLVKLYHILVKHKMSRNPVSKQDPTGENIQAREPQEARNILQSLRDALLKEGSSRLEAFKQVAKQVSDCDGTAEGGGSLGWIHRGQTVREFEDMAFSLRVGELSTIVETPIGLHLAYREG